MDDDDGSGGVFGPIVAFSKLRSSIVGDCGCEACSFCSFMHLLLPILLLDTSLSDTGTVGLSGLSVLLLSS